MRKYGEVIGIALRDIPPGAHTHEHMSGDIDFDAGPAMSREEQVRRGARLFEALVDMASGTASKSEALGFGTEEIVPWQLGAVL